MPDKGPSVAELPPPVDKAPPAPAAPGLPAEGKKEGLAASLKTELGLLGLLVVFIGLVGTESYYGFFGIRYQFLNLGATHILYRGLTILPAAPYLLLPYALAFLWLCIDAWLRNQKTPISEGSRSPIAYGFVILVLALTYPLVQFAGARQAERDAHASNSTLPDVLQLKTPTEYISFPGQIYKLLVIDSDFVIIFHPLQSDDKSARVNLRRFKKGDISLLETN
jgi:hypothetical protein